MSLRGVFISPPIKIGTINPYKETFMPRKHKHQAPAVKRTPKHPKKMPAVKHPKSGKSPKHEEIQ